MLRSISRLQPRLARVIIGAPHGWGSCQFRVPLQAGGKAAKSFVVASFRRPARERESICLLNPIDGRIAFVRACSPPGRPATLLASIRWNVTPPCPRCTVISRSRKIWVQTPRRGCEASVLRAGLMRGRGGQKKRKENGAGRGTATRSPCRHANLAREEVAHSV